MQITNDQVTQMASRLALEARFKDEYIVHLEAENARLRERVAELEPAEEPDAPQP